MTTTTTTTIPHERLAGRRLVLTDTPGRARKRRMLVVGRGPGITLGRGAASVDDPVVEGGSLAVRATAAGGFDVTYDLDGRWRPIMRRGEVRGWRWTGPGTGRLRRLRRKTCTSRRRMFWN